MTEIQKLEVRKSTLRTDINSLLFQEEVLSEEQNETLTQKRAELEDVENRWRIAVETAPDPKEREKETQNRDLSADQLEFARLEDGVNLSGFLFGRPTGESLEYRSECEPARRRFYGLGSWIMRSGSNCGLMPTAKPRPPEPPSMSRAIIDRVTAQLSATTHGHVSFPWSHGGPPLGSTSLPA